MDNDEKLDEVRAILRRLQHIDTGEETDAALDGTTTANAVPKTSAEVAALAPPAAQGQRASPKLMGAVAAGVAMLLIGATGLAFWLGSPGEPPALRMAPQPEIRAPSSGAEREETIAAIGRPTEQRPADAPPPPSAAAIQPPATNGERIAEAQRLIEEGKVTAARELLLSGSAGESAQAALALARSYDPNSLRLIANADAGPDVDEAERWYRRWSELAASEGLALDGFRLERIIKAMR